MLPTELQPQADMKQFCFALFCFVLFCFVLFRFVSFRFVSFGLVLEAVSHVVLADLAV